MALSDRVGRVQQARMKQSTTYPRDGRRLLGDHMCVFLPRPVLRERVGVRVFAVDGQSTSGARSTNPHPALSRITGRGEENVPCPGMRLTSRRRIWSLAWRVMALVFLVATPGALAADRPNVLFILADDLGYGDVGVFYQNAHRADGKPSFATPNLDAMARAGILLRQHYTGAPVCASESVVDHRHEPGTLPHP